MTGAIVAAKVQGQKVLGGVAVGQSGSFNSQPGLDLTIYAQVGIAVCQRTVPSNDTTYEVRGTLLQFTCSP